MDALVAAMADHNVRVGGAAYNSRRAIAATVLVDGLLAGDVSALRDAAGTVFASTVNAEVDLKAAER